MRPAILKLRKIPNLDKLGKWVMITLLVGVIAAGSAPALGRSLGSSSVEGSKNAYDLSWWTVGASPTDITAEDFYLAGTAGQPDAGRMAGGRYNPGGGFWDGVAFDYYLYLPLVIRGS